MVGGSFIVLTAFLSSACGGAERAAPDRPLAEPPASAEPAPQAPTSGPASVDSVADPALIDRALQPWVGDLDGMIERRLIRVLVVNNRMFYTVDLGRERGVNHDLFREFEKTLNDELKTGHLKVNLVFVPVNRERIIDALVEGLGDIAAANLTVTMNRLDQVEFTLPLLADVRKYVITAAGSPQLASLDDLSGKELHVKRSASSWRTLDDLNARFHQEGRPAVTLVAVDEVLEDDDVLEMVNAGLIPATVMDSHVAEFWAQVLPRIIVHRGAPLATEGRKGWAMRRDSPKLKTTLDGFVRTRGKGTLFGNVIFTRYLSSTKWVTNSTTGADLRKFEELIQIFEKYGHVYGFDWLMLAAQGYQESQLDHGRRSNRGAVGVMQLLPSTAADPAVNIPNIEVLENNIHAGTKYLRFIADRYFSDPAIETTDRLLFAFASYNAGPARVARLRKEALRLRLDPNRWFANVEVVAARDIGRETVQYVSNIYKYYVAYRRISDQMKRRERGGSAP
jgi:membrane-bound lytic murein transglycosylase MltF